MPLYGGNIIVPLCHPQISEMYPRNQPVSVETLGIWYREVLLLYKRHSVLVPADLESHFRQLNIRWSSVKERTLLTRTDSDSSIEETLATGELYTSSVGNNLTYPDEFKIFVMHNAGYV